MVWVKVTDRYDEDPKILGAGPLGVALWLAGLAYCNRAETDGFIPEAKTRHLVDWGGAEAALEGWPPGAFLVTNSAGQPIRIDTPYVIDLLVREGLWKPVHGGYQVANYLKYQPSRAALEDQRREAALRQAKSRAKRKKVTE